MGRKKRDCLNLAYHSEPFSRCADCGMPIFGSDEEAVSVGYRFELIVNLAIGGRCFSCAGGRLISREEIGRVAREVKAMLDKREKDGFLKFEVGVPGPRKASRWDPLVRRILKEVIVGDEGVSEWARVLYENKTVARQAQAFLTDAKRGRRLFPGEKLDVSVAIDGEGAWVYIRRRQVEAVAAKVRSNGKVKAAATAPAGAPPNS